MIEYWMTTIIKPSPIKDGKNREINFWLLLLMGKIQCSNTLENFSGMSFQNDNRPNYDKKTWQDDNMKRDKKLRAKTMSRSFLELDSDKSQGHFYVTFKLDRGSFLDILNLISLIHNDSTIVVWINQITMLAW